MTTPKRKALPYLAGIVIVLIVVGFMLGLREVIQFDPASAQVKTTKYIYLYLPISSDTQPTWISPAKPNSPDWQLMHEFHYSAAGTKIKHTHWGAVVDAFQPWEEYRFNSDAKMRLRSKTLELINGSQDVKAKRIYARRIGIQLLKLLDDAQTQDGTHTSTEKISPEMIDSLVDSAYIDPIDAESSMIPDP